jgi:hypothetical protein
MVDHPNQLAGQQRLATIVARINRGEHLRYPVSMTYSGKTSILPAEIIYVH